MALKIKLWMWPPRPGLALGPFGPRSHACHPRNPAASPQRGAQHPGAFVGEKQEESRDQLSTILFPAPSFLFPPLPGMVPPQLLLPKAFSFGSLSSDATASARIPSASSAFSLSSAPRSLCAPSRLTRVTFHLVGQFPGRVHSQFDEVVSSRGLSSFVFASYPDVANQGLWPEHPTRVSSLVLLSHTLLFLKLGQLSNVFNRGRFTGEEKKSDLLADSWLEPSKGHTLSPWAELPRAASFLTGPLVPGPVLCCPLPPWLQVGIWPFSPWPTCLPSLNERLDTWRPHNEQRRNGLGKLFL